MSPDRPPFFSDEPTPPGGDPAPADLRDLMDAASAQSDWWDPSELGEILRHQLATPLPFAPATCEPTPRTFEELLRHAEPVAADLERVVEWADAARRRKRTALPDDVLRAVRAAAIASARLCCGVPSDAEGSADLAWATGLSWVDPWVREMAKAAAGTAPSSDPPPAMAHVPRVPGYDILARLGQGATGTVWRAYQRSAGREVALKWMSAVGLGPKARQRFEREVEVVASLSHRNVAHLYDSGAVEGHFYYAMELVDGVPLDRFVRDRGLTRRSVVSLMALVCAAVQHAHERGVIHRDLKPANVLVSTDGQPHVVDFGLARATWGSQAGLTLSLDGTISGTLGFMSPQQASGQNELVDTRGDVYSLGAILYYVLTGRTPHDVTGSQFEAIRRVAEDDVPAPRKSDPTIDGELQAILLKALARDPAERYATAGGLGDDLQKYLDGEPVSARPPTLMYYARKRLKRHRAAVIVSAAVAAALVGLGAWDWVRVHAARAVAEQRQREAQASAANAREAARLAEVRLAQGLLATGDALMGSSRFVTARQSFLDYLEMAPRLGSPTLAARAASLMTYVNGPPPLLGHDATNLFVRGFEGHRGAVECLAVSRKQEVAVTGGADATVRVWDTTTGTEIRRLTGHAARVTCAALSSDDRWVAAGAENGVLKLFDRTSGNELASVQTPHEGGLTGVAITPDGQTLISAGGDGAVLLWGLKPLLAERAPPPPDVLDRLGSKVLALQLSADGRLALAASERGPIHVWDLQARKLVYTAAIPPAGRRLRGASLSLDGKLVGTVTDADGMIHVHDVATGHEAASVHGLTSAPSVLCFSPDGKTLLDVGGDRTPRIHDLAEDHELRSFGGTPTAIRALAFTTDGQRVLAAAADGSVRLWLVDRWAEFGFSLTQTPTVPAATLMPDRATAVSLDATKRLARQWDLATGHELRDIKLSGDAPTVLAPTPDGALLLVGDEAGRLRFIDATDGVSLTKADGHNGSLRCLSVSSDGATALTGGTDGDLILWDVAARQVRRRIPAAHAKPVVSVALSPDGRRFLSGSVDGRLLLWDAATATVIRPATRDKLVMTAVGWSADGRWIAAGGDDNVIRVWDAQSGQFRCRLDGHVNVVQSLAFSPDGQAMASGGTDASVILWDLSTGRAARTFYGHHAPLVSVSFDAAGGAIFSAGRDGTMHTWNLDRQARYADFIRRLTDDRARLAANPRDPVAMNDFGEWYAFRGVPLLALDMLVRARDAGQRVSPATLARCYWWVGKFAEAQQQFSRAMDEAPDEPTRRYYGLCRAALRGPASQPTTRPATATPR